MNYIYNLTCLGCPEQYDVTDDNDNLIGYIRLRHGILRCDVPYCGGKTIYSHEFSDIFKGMFSNERERKFYLNIIDKKIFDYYKKRRINKEYKGEMTE